MKCSKCRLSPIWDENHSQFQLLRIVKIFRILSLPARSTAPKSYVDGEPEAQHPQPTQMKINWSSSSPARPAHVLPLVLFYALAIWLGTSAFYVGSDAIQGAASGYSTHQAK